MAPLGLSRHLEALGGDEEEQLVLDDRAAELGGDVDLLVGDGRVGEGGVLGDELGLDVVAEEALLRPVDVEETGVPVAARLGERVHDRPGVGAELGGGPQAAHLHLLHEVEVEEGPGRARRRVAGVDPVQEERVAVVLVGPERGAAVDAGQVVQEAGRGVIGADGQVEEQVLREGVVGRARRHVHDRRLADHVHLLGDAAHAEDHGDVDDLGDADVDVVLAPGPEAGDLGDERVVAGLDAHEAEGAFGVRDRRPGAGLAEEGEGDAGQDAALLVLDGAGHGAGEGLGRDGERGDQEEERQDQYLAHGLWSPTAAASSRGRC